MKMHQSWIEGNGFRLLIAVTLGLAAFLVAIVTASRDIRRDPDPSPPSPRAAAQEPPDLRISPQDLAEIQRREVSIHNREELAQLIRRLQAELEEKEQGGQASTPQAAGRNQ